METYEITAEMNLKKIIAESKEVAQALNKFADNLEQIEKKYTEPQEKEENDDKERHSNNNRWCNTCKFNHLESECLGCAEYDEYDNLIDLRNYKAEGGEN